ncbi:MAG: tetratricopeptide repeat protein [Planctomycetota bacterium]|nr:tetratricopeptide repeat protein [Planctomycetota bacterium]
MQGTRLGPYEILSELGTGGMGTVYLSVAHEGAVGVVPGTQVALKVIHPHLLGRSQFEARFRREGRIGRSVRHDNVVSTYDVGTAAMGETEVLFIVMERVVGQTLRSLLEDLDRLPEGLLREIAHQVAAGLAAIHAQGIVHRDLKPENVLVTENHEVRIMDLGVAHVIDETVALTEAGDFAGSLLYAAPEQFGADPVGTPADLYALGVLLYELAAGRHPFASEDAGAIIRGHLEEEPPRLRDLVPEISPFFSETVATLLAKVPAERHPSAAYVRDLFEHGEGSRWWRERQAKRRARNRVRPSVPVPRETALHGRAAELADLRSMWHQARDGQGCAVILEGEAGIGKTRLVDAFLAEVGKEDAHVLYGSYHPAGGIGGLSGSIVDHFGDADLADAVRPYIAQTPTLAPAFAAILQHTTPPASAAPVSGDALTALTVYVMRGLAEERPLLWVVDDLHFAGPDSRKVVLGLARAVEGHPVMLLVTARPGVPDAEWAHFDRLPTVHRRLLERLTERDVTGLLRDALGSEALADRLGRSVARKSDGVPFFVLEIVRALKVRELLEERPDGSFVTTQIIEDIEVPSAVRGLVEARLSALKPDERTILEVGAVQGYEFEAGLVAGVLDMKRIPVLQTLAEIERRSGIVRASGRRMRFDHHQIQEVLHDGLPEALRVEYHAALAEAFAEEALQRGRSPEDLRGEEAVFLATHHIHGSRPAEGLPFLAHALDHLESSYRNEALVELLGIALAEPGLVPPELRVELLLRQAERLGYLGRGTLEREALEEAERLAQADEARHLLAVVKTRLGWCHVRRAHYDRAKLILAEACYLARESGDDAVESAATEALGVVLHRRTRYDDAQEQFQRARELARRAGDLRAEANAVGGVGVVLRALGRDEEARSCYEQQLGMAQRAGDRRGVMNALGNLANLLNYQHDYEGAQRLYEEALDVAREIGDRAGQAAVQGNLASLLWTEGRLAEAHAKFETTLMLDREIGNRDGEAHMLLNIAGLWRVLGASEEARRDYEEALNLCRGMGARLLEGFALIGIAAVERELENYERARELCDRAVELYRDLGQAQGTASALEALATVLEEQGQATAARDTLQEAIDMLDGRGAVAEQALRRCRLATLPDGDANSAVKAFAEGEPTATVLQRLGMLFLFWRATADVRRLDEAWTLLGRVRDEAPALWRDTMIERVRLHREIKHDYERVYTER